MQNWNEVDKKLKFCVRNIASSKISWCERFMFGSTLFDFDGTSVGGFIHNVDMFDLVDSRIEDTDYQAELDKKEMAIWDLELQVNTLREKLQAYELKDALQRSEAEEYAQSVGLSEETEHG